MHVMNLQDKVLSERLKRQDAEALGAIYDRYVTSIYRYVYLKVPTQQDAEDVTSDVFLKLWNYSQSSENDILNVRALLYQIARTTVVDFYRRRARTDEVPNDESLLENIPDERQQSFFQELDTDLAVTDVEKALRQMKDEYREVITLRYIEQLSTQEIAEVLGKSKGAVRVLLMRALNVARELLEHKK